MSVNKREYGTDLTSGPIPVKMISFAWPLFLGNLFQQLYNAADSLIVGNFLGSKSLAAVTSTGSLTFLMVGFFNGIALGAGVIISNFYGAKDEKNLRLAIHTNLAFGLAAGIILTAIGVIFTPQILILMGCPKEVLPYSILYLRVYFLGSVFVLLYNICMGILQAVGDSKTPLYYLMLSSMINIVLDLLFCGYFRWGVEYAALATIISQFVSVVLCLRKLMTVEEVYQVKIKEIKFHRGMTEKIIVMGFPTGIQNSVISIANVVVQSNINAFGQMAMAGCGAYSKIEGFGFLSITCFTMALTTFISQNRGAKKYDRVKKGIIFGVGCALLMAEITGIMINFFAADLIGLFDQNEQVISYGVLQAKTVTIFYFLLSFSHAAAAIMRGLNKPVIPMAVMLVSWCLIRISYITTVTKFTDNIRFVFMAYPITWSISSLLFIICLGRRLVLKKVHFHKLKW